MAKNRVKEKRERLKRRHRRVRAKVFGTAEVPRLSVYRSLKHIYAQIINDKEGETLAAASDLKIKQGTKTERAKEVGKMIAKLAQEKGIKKVVFDRGGRKYHGRIKALAEAAREGGLKF